MTRHNKTTILPMHHIVFHHIAVRSLHDYDPTAMSS